MRRLLLLRHAKATPAGRDDQARKLTGQGRRDAALIGARLRKYCPIELVLCSPSARTRETWQLVAKEVGRGPDAQFPNALYLAPAAVMLSIVQGIADQAQSMLIVGHNPGTEELAAKLARDSQSKDERRWREIMAEKFPTAALAVLEFDVGHWRDAVPHAGALAAFVRPKDLE
jgi:phosphohistidine phosphatase